MLLALCMVLMGCSPGNSGANSSGNAGNQVSPSASPSGGTVETGSNPTEWTFDQSEKIRFIDSVGYTPKVKKLTIQTNNRVIDEGNLVDKWLENQLGVEIDWIILSSKELSTKLNLLSASSSLPDVVTLPSNTNVNDYYNLLNSGLLLDIEDLLNQYGKHIRQVRTDEQIEVLRHTDGKLYALNSNVESDTEMTMIRKDWLDKLNLAIPKTTSEFRDVMYAFVHNDPDGNGQDDTFGYYGYSGRKQTFSIFWSAFNANPYQWVWGDDGSIVHGVTKTDELIEAVSYLQSMYADGLINQDYLTASNTSYQDMATANRQGCTEAQLWFSDHYMQAMYLYGNGDPNTDWICLPGLNGGSYLTFNNPNCRQYTCITVDSKDPVLGMLYLDLLAHTDVYKFIRMGYEGEHYYHDEELGVDKLVDKYLKDNSLLINQGITATYAMPFLATDPAPGQFTARTESFRQARRAGEKAYYAAIYLPIPKIEENLLNAGMSDYISQVINETIMDSSKNVASSINEMVNTLYAKYNLKTQTEYANEYADLLGLKP